MTLTTNKSVEQLLVGVAPEQLPELIAAATKLQEQNKNKYLLMALNVLQEWLDDAASMAVHAGIDFRIKSHVQIRGSSVFQLVLGGVPCNPESVKICRRSSTFLHTMRSYGYSGDVTYSASDDDAPRTCTVVLTVGLPYGHEIPGFNKGHTSLRELKDRVIGCAS